MARSKIINSRDYAGVRSTFSRCDDVYLLTDMDISTGQVLWGNCTPVVDQISDRVLTDNYSMQESRPSKGSGFLGGLAKMIGVVGLTGAAVLSNMGYFADAVSLTGLSMAGSLGLAEMCQYESFQTVDFNKDLLNRGFLPLSYVKG